MVDISLEPASSAQDEPVPTLSDLFRRAQHDMIAWIKAEIGFYQAQAKWVGRSAAMIAGLAMLAIVLAQAALVGLIVGLLFTLAPHMGIGWATVTVCGGAVVLIVILGLIARAKVKSLATLKRGGV
jgi:hypothetical protein